jgi:hypothetical protein
MTLIELAAAAGFLATALLGAVASIASASALAIETEETRLAQRTAASLMENVRATRFEDLVEVFHGSSHAVTSPSGADGAADIAIQEVPNATAPWTVYEVRILVRWERPDASRAVEVRTYVSDRVRGSGIALKTTVAAN